MRLKMTPRFDTVALQKEYVRKTLAKSLVSRKGRGIVPPAPEAGLRVGIMHARRIFLRRRQRECCGRFCAVHSKRRCARSAFTAAANAV